MFTLKTKQPVTINHKHGSDITTEIYCDLISVLLYDPTRLKAVNNPHGGTPPIESGRASLKSKYEYYYFHESKRYKVIDLRGGVYKADPDTLDALGDYAATLMTTSLKESRKMFKKFEISLTKQFANKFGLNISDIETL